MTMDYREQPPPAALTGLVKAWWSLDAGGEAGSELRHLATPDGCVEIIRRLRGRSCWGEAQPACFAVGLIDKPEAFTVSGDARFVAVRLWPWAWSLFSDTAVGTIRGTWGSIGDPRLERLCEALPVPAAGTLETWQSREAAALAAMGRIILTASSVAEIGARSGLAPRALQRWFAQHVGLAPRTYLRLLRFQRAFETLPEETSLAGHAAEHGFADQAHMARNFSSLAGVPARTARRHATGPFLSRKAELS
jgi:AraC-like DNA-binding protein